METAGLVWVGGADGLRSAPAPRSASWPPCRATREGLFSVWARVVRSPSAPAPGTASRPLCRARPELFPGWDGAALPPLAPVPGSFALPDRWKANPLPVWRRAGQPLCTPGSSSPLAPAGSLLPVPGPSPPPPCRWTLDQPPSSPVSAAWR
ncbi:hypothetical protein [Paenibacillus zeisoli]|uniref:hypothetical protein n=1 Tax=Paenibacillus zeisoli TaxID=2496267 RepID=UPI00163BFE9C|nr:hypothetical protein [Paenibacillus zeisoli]